MINLQTEIHLALKLKMRRGHDIKTLEKVRILIIQVMMTVHIHLLKIIMINKNRDCPHNILQARKPQATQRLVCCSPRGLQQ